MTSLGTLGTAETLGTLEPLGTLGTLEMLGTLGTLGTLGNLEPLGTLGNLGNLGKLGNLGELGNLENLGNLYLGTFTWKPLLGNLDLGTFTWEPWANGFWSCSGLLRNLYYGWRPQSFCCWGKNPKTILLHPFFLLRGSDLIDPFHPSSRITLAVGFRD